MKKILITILLSLFITNNASAYWAQDLRDEQRSWNSFNRPVQSQVIQQPNVTPRNVKPKQVTPKKVEPVKEKVKVVILIPDFGQCKPTDEVVKRNIWELLK